MGRGRGTWVWGGGEAAATSGGEKSHCSVGRGGGGWAGGQAEVGREPLPLPLQVEGSPVAPREEMETKAGRQGGGNCCCYFLRQREIAGGEGASTTTTAASVPSPPFRLPSHSLPCENLYLSHSAFAARVTPRFCMWTGWQAAQQGLPTNWYTVCW